MGSVSTSRCELIRRGGARLAALVLLVTAGCDKLQPDPGGDFQVRVSGEYYEAVGKITFAVPVTVTGCKAFDLEVRAGDWTAPVSYEPQPDGTVLAEVPVEPVSHADTSCTADAAFRQWVPTQLVATCRDAHRQATADFGTVYGAATVAYGPGDFGPPGTLLRSTIEQVYPSADPLRPYALEVSPLLEQARLLPDGVQRGFRIDVGAERADPLARPRLAAGSGRLFLSAGCESSAACPPVAVAPGVSVPSERLVTGADPAGDVWVPATVLDLAFLADGRLVVLSQVGAASWPASAADGGTVVSVVSSGASGFVVTPIAFFPGEVARTLFSRTADGHLVFLTYAHGGNLARSMLHATDGDTISSVNDPAGDLPVDPMSPPGVWLSPDAASMLVSVNSAPNVDELGMYLGAPGATFALLPGDLGMPQRDGFGATWPATGFALWAEGASLLDPPSPGPTSTSNGVVMRFDATPPHARTLFHQVQPLSGGPPVELLYGVIAVGDDLVLTTNSGVRVLGPDGTIIGGSDPLPCGLTPTSLATATGPSTFAVGAGNHLFVFDVAALSHP
jgi:hypothetical protein